jgi:predicted component of type VI protein secretion system
MRLSTLLTSGVSTFAFYVELQSFLAELMGLFPIHSIREVTAYDHNDAAAAFTETITYIRSFIQAEGGAAYIRYPFAPVTSDAGHYLTAQVVSGDLAGFDEAYIAVQCSINELDLIAFLEAGDKFKLTSGTSQNQRTRGIKLSAVRYPPRVLPVITGAIWFKMDTENSPKIWEEIRRGGSAVIDYASELFPNLETNLFVTVSDATGASTGTATGASTGAAAGNATGAASGGKDGR